MALVTASLTAVLMSPSSSSVGSSWAAKAAAARRAKPLVAAAAQKFKGHIVLRSPLHMYSPLSSYGQITLEPPHPALGGPVLCGTADIAVPPSSHPLPGPDQQGDAGAVHKVTPERSSVGCRQEASNLLIQPPQEPLSAVVVQLT